MFEAFEIIDIPILLFFNSHHSSFMDMLMWDVSDRYIWVPMYAALQVGIAMKFGWRRSLKILFCIVAAVVLTDKLCAAAIRPAVERLRPSNPDNPISSMITLVNGYRGGRYGFPSCHAANTMALALFISMLFKSPKVRAIIIGWSVMVSFSRLYLGVHYPSDIVAGWIIGSLISLTFFRFYEYTTRACDRKVLLERNNCKTFSIFLKIA